ncbi:MAG: hypothetical protein NTX50_01025 [Candidatus Sumerlaeota bacterium]|nr:hypothetical protein [Candidatus Sumerlaeota bacterium]
MAALMSLMMAKAACAGDITGTFRFQKDEYCVGEAMWIEFIVENGTDKDYCFYEGSDYRCWPSRHTRYYFQITDEAGREYVCLGHDNMGGIGNTHTLKPGNKAISYQLLNSWAPLLSPGQYRVSCRRTLEDAHWRTKSEMRSLSTSVTISQEIPLHITEYDRDKVAIASAKSESAWFEEKPQGFTVIEFKQHGWMLSDLAEKFHFGASLKTQNRRLQEFLQNHLPERWDDWYFMQYEWHENRNWLTASNPEEYILAIRVWNASKKTLAHELARSSMTINGTRLAQLQDLIREKLKANKIGDTLKPFERIEIPIRLNSFLSGAEEQEIVLHIRSFDFSRKVWLRK